MLLNNLGKNEKGFGLLLLICLNTNGGSVFGQKVFKPIKASLKAKNGTEALKLVSKLEGDTTVNALPQLYDMGKEAQIILNDVENEKLYLKQPYDTAKFSIRHGGFMTMS